MNFQKIFFISVSLLLNQSLWAKGSYVDVGCYPVIDNNGILQRFQGTFDENTLCAIFIGKKSEAKFLTNPTDPSQGVVTTVSEFTRIVGTGSALRRGGVRILGRVLPFNKNPFGEALPAMGGDVLNQFINPDPLVDSDSIALASFIEQLFLLPLNGSLLRDHNLEQVTLSPSTPNVTEQKRTGETSSRREPSTMSLLEFINNSEAKERLKLLQDMSKAGQKTAISLLSVLAFELINFWNRNNNFQDKLGKTPFLTFGLSERSFEDLMKYATPKKLGDNLRLEF
jgi:hypothetical protein